MKIQIFQSEKGDCLLLESEKGGTVLADGGMRESFAEHVAPVLAKRKAIDLVYVSHIDEDHISGILELLDNKMAWRVFEHQQKSGATKAKKPKVPRPPELRALWHNAFSAQLDGIPSGTARFDSVASCLIDMAALAQGPTPLQDSRPADFYGGLIQSHKQALQVSYRASAGQLGIPVNGGEPLMTVENTKKPIKLKGFNLHVIGPAQVDLDKLREEFDAWVQKSRTTLRALREQAEKDAGLLASDFDRMTAFLALAAKELGDRTKVTAPNLASLMLLVEEGGRQALMTGDGHWADILKGLELQKFVPKDGPLHVDVLKVQHHGSEHNIKHTFTKRISADHYIFCGNGKHENPDLDAVKLLIDSRLSPKSEGFAAAAPKTPFTFWFNCSSAVLPKGAPHRAHMVRLEKLIAARQAGANGNRLKANFLDGGSFTLSLP
jgi:beta-lactamase superfamily II metal-dependent hydrolase